jgi:glycosyltransferase involved in cell wall biosynthesis
MPTVSVILNCYNHDAYVAEAIESVLTQSFADFELIVIDNGSTDATRAVIQRYDDPRIRLALHDENVSLSRRLNQGVAMAEGAFVAVLYSDDYMLPDKLERQVALLEQLPPDYGVVYCPALGLNQHTKQTWQHRSFALDGSIFSLMLERHFAGPVDMASPLTRRECFVQSPWHEDLFGDGEAVFWRIALDWKFRFDPHPAVVLRDHGGNMGKAVRVNHEMTMTNLDRLEAVPRLARDQRKAVARHRANCCIRNSWAYVRLGGDDRQWVGRQLRRALRSSPPPLLDWRLAATALLGALPRPLRSSVNRLGDKARATPDNRALVESY